MIVANRLVDVNHRIVDLTLTGVSNPSYRLTNAFSKKLENHLATVALYFM